MKITRNNPPVPFVPVMIHIESLQELVCMRAILDAARREQTVTDVMREYWCRHPDAGPPQPEDAKRLASQLRDVLPPDEMRRAENDD